MPSPLPTHFECINPILRVEHMAASVRDYVDVLGFDNAEWGTEEFTHVGREGKGISLCRGGQGHAGAWVWIGVGDVRALHAEYESRGAIVRRKPKNEPSALEMQIEDPDGNVRRFGSDSEEGA